MGVEPKWRACKWPLEASAQLFKKPRSRMDGAKDDPPSPPFSPPRDGKIAPHAPVAQRKTACPWVALQARAMIAHTSSFRDPDTGPPQRGASRTTVRHRPAKVTGAGQAIAPAKRDTVLRQIPSLSAVPSIPRPSIQKQYDASPHRKLLQASKTLG